MHGMHTADGQSGPNFWAIVPMVEYYDEINHIVGGTFASGREKLKVGDFDLALNIL